MTAVGPRPRALDFTALATVGLHPTKIAILEHIGAHGNVAATPKDIAEAIGVPLGSTSYHIRQLVEKKLLRLTRTEPRRGALQHFYVVTAKALLSGPQEARERLQQGANGRARDAGELLFDVLARNGLAIGRFAEQPDPYRLQLRKAGREVFGVA